jgi:hypothetical protein
VAERLAGTVPLACRPPCLAAPAPAHALPTPVWAERPAWTGRGQGLREVWGGAGPPAPHGFKPTQPLPPPLAAGAWRRMREPGVCVSSGFGGRGGLCGRGGRGGHRGARDGRAWPCGSDNGIDGETEATLRKDLAHIKDLRL